MHKAFVHSFIMNPEKACSLGTTGCCCPFVLSLSQSREKQTLKVFWTTCSGERHAGVLMNAGRRLRYMSVLQWETAFHRLCLPCSCACNKPSMKMIALDRFHIKSFVLVQWAGTSHLITACTVTDFQIAYWFSHKTQNFATVVLSQRGRFKAFTKTLDYTLKLWSNYEIQVKKKKTSQ